MSNQWDKLSDRLLAFFSSRFRGENWGDRAALSELRSVRVKLQDPELRLNRGAFEDVLGRLEVLAGEFSADDQRRAGSLLSALEHCDVNYVRRTPHNAERESHSSTDVLVVCALEHPELSQFLALLDDTKPRTSAFGAFTRRRTWTRGVLKAPSQDLKVVAISQERMGSVDTAALVAHAMWEFQPRIALMVGVCAGRQGEVEIGDVVAPHSILTYDTGKLTDSGLEPEPHFVEVRDVVGDRLRTQGKEVLKAVAQRVSASAPVTLREPALHTEVLACGSVVMNRRGKLDEIAATLHRKIVGLDMESYGFLRGVSLVDGELPAFVAKGVMDFASSKTDKAKREAAFWSAQFAAEFLRREFATVTKES